jgi:hypothetical protein
LSAQKKPKADVENPKQADDSAFGEKTLVAEEKDLETVIIDSKKTAGGSAEAPSESPDSTVVAPLSDARETGKDGVSEDKTVITKPADPELRTASPEPGPSSEPKLPKESNIGGERVSERPAKAQPGAGPGDRKMQSERKGSGMKNFLLGIFLLLVLGVGAVVTLRMVNPDAEILKLIPFKWGADTQQQAIQTPDVGTQAGIPSASRKYDQVEMGMTGNAVLQVLGEPLRKKTVNRTSQWEYDTGTGLFQVKFQNDLVLSVNTAAYSETIGTQAAAPQTIPPPVATYTPTTQVSASAGAKDFDRIQVGMTPESVRQIVGDPQETRTIGQLTEWEYDIKTGLFQVAFQGGKVAFKGRVPYHTVKSDQAPPSTTLPGSAAPGGIGAQATPSSTTAPRDYNKVVIGMPLEGVRQLLGDPWQVKKLRTSIEWEYQTPKGIFEVRFKNDKVVFKGMVPAGAR